MSRYLYPLRRRQSRHLRYWPAPSSLRRSLSPSLRQRVLEAELVERAADDEVDEILHRLGAVVEARREKEDRRARLTECEHVAQVDRRERRLARHHDQPALLLDCHRRRTMDEVLHRA